MTPATATELLDESRSNDAVLYEVVLRFADRPDEVRLVCASARARRSTVSSQPSRMLTDHRSWTLASDR